MARLGLIQVKMAEDGETVTAGGLILAETTDCAEAVQPLAAVTVTVYVFGADTLMDEVDAPLLHEYDTPPCAVSVADETMQLSVAD